MKSSATFLALILWLVPGLASAACEKTPEKFLTGASRGAPVARGEAYIKLCLSDSTPLVDVDDVRLAGRLVVSADIGKASQKFRSDLMGYIPDSMIMFLKEKLAAKYVMSIEADGFISSVTLIGPSGNKDFDTAVVSAAKRTKRYGVYKLDGQTVRAFVTLQATFEMRDVR
jgi:hypothetical protein